MDFTLQHNNISCGKRSSVKKRWSCSSNNMKYKKELSAGGIVFKKEGSNAVWLITQHSQHKGWGFPKGIIGDIADNEKVEDAALREVREEGGIVAKIVNDTQVEVKYKYTSTS